MTIATMIVTLTSHMAIISWAKSENEKKKLDIKILLYTPKKHAYNRIGGGNLVLRHSFSHFTPNFSRHCVLSGGLNAGFTLVPERTNENIYK